MGTRIDSSTPQRAGFSLEARSEFSAFNTTASAVVADWTEAWRLPRVQAHFAAFEARFSRFRPDSELGRLNEHAGEPTVVSPEMLSLLAACQRFAAISCNAFNPLILSMLEAAGYDRSFELLVPSADYSTASGIENFEIDLVLDRSEVTLPAGSCLDLGGIGKGYAVDEAISLLASDNCLVEAGGDLYAAGRSPEGAAWVINVAHPLDEETAICQIGLSDRAVATSSTAKRRWWTGEGWKHHIIDPRTGRHVINDILSVTVVAPEAVAADVYAKAALILGISAGFEFLQSLGAEGLMVLADGSVLASRHWSDLQV